MKGTKGVTNSKLHRGGRLSNRLSRLRHFRGHGVHSPFVYSIVRNVFMAKRVLHGDQSLLAELHLAGINPTVAIEIANLAAHCHIKSCSLDCFCSGKELTICSSQLSDSAIKALYDKASESGTAIAIVAPYARRKLCNTLLEGHNGTSIDRYSYLVLLNNNLPKQHFKL